MRFQRLLSTFGALFLVIAAPRLRADQVEMQNGDRYAGKVVSVSEDTVVLDSDLLGKVTLPRKKVAALMMGANVAVPKMASNIIMGVAAPANPPVKAPTSALANTNVDLSAELRQLGANTNFVGQIRQQMLAGSPEAAGKYDEMVNGLMSGQLNLNDLRREAQSDADQLRELKRDLGSDAGDSIDAYLSVLDSFLKETANEPTNAIPAPQAKQ